MLATQQSPTSSFAFRLDLPAKFDPESTPDVGGEVRPEDEPQLRIEVLRTREEREVIAELRRQTAPSVALEDDLGAGLLDYESARDDAGVVTAIFRGAKLIATLRFVPSGRRLTIAECVPGGIGPHGDILGKGNWEVGRLFVDPDERSPEVLHRCLSLALQALMAEGKVLNLYAVSTLMMSRLWRRFGLQPTWPLSGRSGRKFVLVSGSLPLVAASLHVPLTGQHAVSDVTTRHDGAVAFAG